MDVPNHDKALQWVRWFRRLRLRGKITVLAIPLILLAGWSAFTYFGPLRAERSRNRELRRDSDSLATENEALTRERDKLETQLAPFLAAANRSFPEAPADQRLDLLLEKMDQLIKAVQDAARKISPDRVLTQDTMRRVTTSLRSAPRLNVDILCLSGDAESFSLATQICEAFKEAGWQLEGATQAIFDQPVKGLLIQFGKRPPKQIQQAIAAIFDGLGYASMAEVNHELPEDLLKTTVGAK